MDTLVVRPTNEPGTQGGRQALESGAVARTDAPGATQHQRYRRVRPERLFQDVNPFKQGMPCGLVWAHVDPLAGMPEYCLMVNYTIEIQIENHVRTARGGCWKIGRSLVKGHGGHAEILRLFDHVSMVRNLTDQFATNRQSTTQSGLLQLRWSLGLGYPCNRVGQPFSSPGRTQGRWGVVDHDSRGSQGCAQGLTFRRMSYSFLKNGGNRSAWTRGGTPGGPSHRNQEIVFAWHQSTAQGAGCQKRYLSPPTSLQGCL